MKTLLVPGWMKSVKYYGEFDPPMDGLDIWKKDFVLNDSRSVECVIAHSMGALYALAEENIGNEKTKYFLVNPLLEKRSFVFWFWRWVKCAISGDVKIDPQMSFKNILSAIKKAIKYSQYDISKALEKISKDNIVVIRGDRDNYFCDKKALNVAKNYGIKVVEKENLGHEWREGFKEVLVSLMI